LRPRFNPSPTEAPRDGPEYYYGEEEYDALCDGADGAVSVRVHQSEDRLSDGRQGRQVGLDESEKGAQYIVTIYTVSIHGAAMTDPVILGFLMRGPKSGYDIKRLMALSTAHFYQASFGSIYPSLERMEKELLIESERSEESGRLRKVYTILPAGKAAFREWLASPLDIAKGPSFLLARLFFMGSLSPAEAKKSLGLFAESAKKRRQWLEGVLDALPATETPDFFQASTQAFGLEYYAFLEDWLRRQAGKAALRRGNHD
jgi:DNA-binding PadR family transcriptional regulator